MTKTNTLILVFLTLFSAYLTEFVTIGDSKNYNFVIKENHENFQDQFTDKKNVFFTELTLSTFNAMEAVALNEDSKPLQAILNESLVKHARVYFLDEKDTMVIMFVPVEGEDEENAKKFAIENRMWRGMELAELVDEDKYMISDYLGVSDIKDYVTERYEKNENLVTGDFKNYFGIPNEKCMFMMHRDYGTRSLTEVLTQTTQRSHFFYLLRFGKQLADFVKRMNKGKEYLFNLNPDTIWVKDDIDSLDKTEDKHIFYKKMLSFNGKERFVRIWNFSELQRGEDEFNNVGMKIAPGYTPPGGVNGDDWGKWDSYSIALTLLDVHLTNNGFGQVSDLLDYARDNTVPNLQSKNQAFLKLMFGDLKENISEILKIYDEGFNINFVDKDESNWRELSEPNKYFIVLCGVIAYFQSEAFLKNEISIVKGLLEKVDDEENVKTFANYKMFADAVLINFSIQVGVEVVQYLCEILMKKSGNRDSPEQISSKMEEFRESLLENEDVDVADLIEQAFEEQQKEEGQRDNNWQKTMIFKDFTQTDEITLFTPASPDEIMIAFPDRRRMLII
jgi:hypothetical protein